MIDRLLMTVMVLVTLSFGYLDYLYLLLHANANFAASDGRLLVIFFFPEHVYVHASARA